MKILHVTSEAYPIYKIGGLGDYSGSLPKALTNLQVDVRITLPKHPQIKLEENHWHTNSTFEITYDRQILPVTIHTGHLPNSNLPVYLIEENKYLSQPTKASKNHADKYNVFCLALATWLKTSGNPWQPQLIHLQDWHTAMLPVILKHKFNDSSHKTVITIHNLAYQGDTNTPILQKLNLPKAQCRILSWDSVDNCINMLMEGILHTDVTSTVSPTYAHEILTQQYGEKLEDILQVKKHNLTGILNGIDYQTFNPSTDNFIYQKFSPGNVFEGKKENKKHLLKELKLTLDNKLLISFIGRVDPRQKGIALIIQALKKNQITGDDANFIFLGTGEPIVESQLRNHCGTLPNCRITTRFDEPLARKIYASSDLIIIPSKYEPCGLVQMIAMRYGAIPVARKTGGLADTIAHLQNGFLFDDYSAQALTNALAMAKQYFASHRQEMVKNALSSDFSWKRSAQKYLDLFQKVILEKNNTPSNLNTH